jgi:transposase
MKSYLLKESLDRLWNYRYPGAMVRYLLQWIDQLRWQRLRPMEKLADMTCCQTSARDPELLRA